MSNPHTFDGDFAPGTKTAVLEFTQACIKEGEKKEAETVRRLNEMLPCDTPTIVVGEE